MASQAQPETPGTFRFEFDSSNKILRLRVEGTLSDDLLAACYREVRKYSLATDASAGIWDFSGVTQVSATSEFIRQLARREPAMPDAINRPRFIVAPATTMFGVSRMFQIIGEAKRPLLKVVRTMGEAITALGIQSAHFEALE